MQSHTAVSMHLQGMAAVIEKHGSPYNMEPLARKCVSFLAYWAWSVYSASSIVRLG